jgi:hypothetical protein
MTDDTSAAKTQTRLYRKVVEVNDPYSREQNKGFSGRVTHAPATVRK